MLFDTDVLIWLSRGNQKAANLINQAENPFLSSISHMEFLQGALNKRDLKSLIKAVEILQFEILHPNDVIAEKATEWIKKYCLSHSLNSSDALIAATAYVHGLPLISANKKHFEPLVKEGLNFIWFEV